MTARPWTRVRGRWWRVLVPKWAHDPLAGKGAALYGGRFNAAGDAALYLSADVATAVAEYQNMIAARPGTFCVYQVDVAKVVDAADPIARRRWRIEASDLTADWRNAASRGHEPRSWRLARRLRTEASISSFGAGTKRGAAASRRSIRSRTCRKIKALGRAALSGVPPRRGAVCR